MKIKEAKNESRLTTRPDKRSARRRRILLVLGLLAVCASVGGIFASKFVKQKGFTGLLDFVSTYSSNYIKSWSAEPEQVSIEIKPEDYKQLEQRRNQALERGLIINEEGSYVPAVIHYGNKRIKVKMRLKGHMTDHVTGDKWSFRIKVKDNESFMGMRLFSLQHPGTRGYAYEWVYHQLMKREDIIALRYTFVNLTLNGKDLGIYAVEENFDEELIENNQRKKGPIVRFNPSLYWVDRYKELQGNRSVSEFASFQSANLEPYREDKVMNDPEMKKLYSEAFGLMEGFRRGKLATHEVFDIERLARFHAIIDLVGGEHSLDWSDIKYYYNPVTAKLEPVAYESFTAFPVTELAGSYHYSERDSNEMVSDFHTELFSDPVFFRQYIRELERITRSAYLDSFFTSIQKPLDNNIGILYKEFPYKKFEKEMYYKNQSVIREMLNTPKGLHAFYKSRSGDTLHLQLGGIESLPLEVIGVYYEGKLIASPVAPVILQCKQANSYVNYKDAGFVLLPNAHSSDSLFKDLKIEYSILGSTVKKAADVFPYPYSITSSVSGIVTHKAPNLADFPYIHANDSLREIFVMPGTWKVSHDMVIPAGYIVRIGAATKLDLEKNAMIVSYSPFDVQGTEEEPVVFTSSDKTGRGLLLLHTMKGSLFNYATFNGINAAVIEDRQLTGAVTFYESPVEFSYCIFSDIDSEDGVNIIRSRYSFAHCVFSKMKNDGLDTDFSQGVVYNCIFKDCAENAMDITMGTLSLRDVNIDRVQGTALHFKSGADVKANGIQITDAATAIAAEDLAVAEINNITITKSKLGFTAFNNKPGAGPAFITAQGVVFKDVAQQSVVEKKSEVIINGIKVTEKVKNAEKMLK